MSLHDALLTKAFGGGSGGVSSWNDLTDKPFGESENAVLLPPTELFFDGSTLFVTPGYIEFIPGKTYTVNWNGVDYKTEAVPGQFNGQDLVMIGNPAALGGTNNNLPFAVACLMGSIGAIPLDGSTAVNVGITGYGIVPIPASYKNEYHLKLLIEQTSSNSTYKNDGSVSLAEYVLQSGGELFLDVTTVNKDTGRVMYQICPLIAYGTDLRGFKLPDAFFDGFDPNSGCNCLIFGGNSSVNDNVFVLCPQANGMYY